MKIIIFDRQKVRGEFAKEVNSIEELDSFLLKNQEFDKDGIAKYGWVEVKE